MSYGSGRFLGSIKKFDSRRKREFNIKGGRKQEKEEKNKKYHRIERFYGIFSRSFSIPEGVDAEKIKASFKDGMLNLGLPKLKPSKPKSVEVKINGRKYKNK